MNRTALYNLQPTDYYDAFKKLYYHLYSNSSASRAERIIADLSKLLLATLVKGDHQEMRDFLIGKSSANKSILPLLVRRFPNIVKESDLFAIDDFSLREGLKSIDYLDLQNAPSHVIGDAFQALMGPRLRGDKGQFFTPKSVVRCMIEILSPGEGVKVVDPACGTGGFLTETAFFWKRNGLVGGSLVGIDKDSDLSMLTSALLEISSPENGHVHNKNSLNISELKASFQNAPASPFEADVVLTNPPFGAKIPVKDKAILEQFDLGRMWDNSSTKGNWRQTAAVRGSQDPQILFIELCIRLLKPKGRMAIILPEGVFGNKGVGYVWDYIRSQGKITALLDCPRTTFQPGTDTKTNILFFEKGDAFKGKTVKIAVALQCGHDRRGRTVKADGSLYPDDFVDIANEWRAKEQTFWSSNQLTNPYYLVPRYYDKKTEELLANELVLESKSFISFKEMKEKGWINIKKGNEVGSDAYGTGDVPFVRTSDINNFEMSVDPTKAVSHEIYTKYKAEQNLKPGDILMVVDGRYRIGKCAILHETNYECIAQSHLRVISLTDKAPFEAVELLYLLSLPSIQREIRSLVFIQSTLGSLGSRIMEIKIPLINESEAWKRTIQNFSYVLAEREKLLKSLIRYNSDGLEL